MTTGKMNLSYGEAAEAAGIAERLRKNGFTAYFAGGCVRDFLMGKEPHDFDVATSATPEKVEALFPRTVPVGRQFGVILVIDSANRYYEVATFRKDGGYQDGRHPEAVSFSGPEEDAARRDFTINGMFYDPEKEAVIDFVGGQKDLEQQMIRAIGDPHQRFEEDKLRLLRAIRFASTLHFKIENLTWQALVGEAPKISCVSVERIREEIVKMLMRSGATEGLQLLSQSGLLRVILPEIENLKEMTQAPGFSADHNLLQMTCLLLDKMELSSEALAFAGLFYYFQAGSGEADAESAQIYSQNNYARITQAAEVLRRLKASNEVIEYVSEVLDCQHLFYEVREMREGQLKLFLSRESFQDELKLHQLHCQNAEESLEFYDFICKKLIAYKDENLRPEALLNGHDLIELGMEPGPAMKPVLEEAYLLQLEGKLPDKKGAMDWAKQQAVK